MSLNLENFQVLKSKTYELRSWLKKKYKMFFVSIVHLYQFRILYGVKLDVIWNSSQINLQIPSKEFVFKKEQSR